MTKYQNAVEHLLFATPCFPADVDTHGLRKFLPRLRSASLCARGVICTIYDIHTPGIPSLAIVVNDLEHETDMGLDYPQFGLVGKSPKYELRILDLGCSCSHASPSGEVNEFFDQLILSEQDMRVEGQTILGSVDNLSLQTIVLPASILATLFSYMPRLKVVDYQIEVPQDASSLGASDAIEIVHRSLNAHCPVLRQLQSWTHPPASLSDQMRLCGLDTRITHYGIRFGFSPEDVAGLQSLSCGAPASQTKNQRKTSTVKHMRLSFKDIDSISPSQAAQALSRSLPAESHLLFEVLHGYRWTEWHKEVLRKVQGLGLSAQYLPPHNHGCHLACC